jgi:hypothetical protein
MFSGEMKVSQCVQYTVSAFVVNVVRYTDLSEKKATTKSINVIYTKIRPANNPKTTNSITVFINMVCVLYAMITYLRKIISNTVAKLTHNTGTIAPMDSKIPVARNKRTPERVDNA